MGTPRKDDKRYHYGTPRKGQQLEAETGIVKGNCGRCGKPRATSQRTFEEGFTGLEMKPDGTLLTKQEAQDRLAAQAIEWAEGLGL